MNKSYSKAFIGGGLASRLAGWAWQPGWLATRLAGQASPAPGTQRPPRRCGCVATSRGQGPSGLRGGAAASQFY